MTANAVCDVFSSAMGGAWPWCETCGWQSEHHATPSADQTSLFAGEVTDLPETIFETRDS